MSNENTLDVSPNLSEVLNQLADKSDNIFWVTSPDLSHTYYVNSAFAKITGYSCEDFYVNPLLWLDIMHPEDRARHPDFKQLAAEIVRQGSAGRYQQVYRIIRLDGEVRWIDDKGFPITDKQGRCIALAGTAIDITAQHEASQALRDAKERAESANQARTQFLATMSHELRTPINAVLGMAQVLAMKSLTQEEQQEYIDVIHQSAKDLLRLIDDTLDFARSEAGSLRIVNKPFSLVQTIERIVLKNTYRANEKNLLLITDLAHDLPQEVEGDAGRFSQVLSNLLDNAIKFTECGHVTVHAKLNKQTADQVWVYLTVEDSGIGIPQEQLDSIFNRFTQVHNASDQPYVRKYHGVGLGLAIVKQLVEVMGGRISVRSQPEKGTLFTLSLPFKVRHWQRSSDIGEAPTPKALYANYKILMVEDNDLNQKVAALMLNELGCDVEIADTGLAALEMLKNNRYDLVLMDIGLPDMSGLEVTATYRRMEPADRHMPIIALTAHALEGDHKTCLEAGMDDYLVKPLMMDRLCATLKQWLLEPRQTETLV